MLAPKLCSAAKGRMKRELTMATEQLTEREMRALEHLRKAAELEVGLAEYARSFELDVKELYSAKQSIAKKGLLPVREGEQDTLADFLEVQLAAPAPSPLVPAESAPVCRIRHPGGLVIECMAWPSAQWLARLAGCIHVPA
jgi:hypothetical protein